MAAPRADRTHARLRRRPALHARGARVDRRLSRRIEPHPGGERGVGTPLLHLDQGRGRS
ncbi:hypothetical protein SBRY_10197 [Actinacidiphila bryophytorum]|uniref:Uncharacterized protein n=1 Tax=Actinacidiphila bryophytorum TaxID=1436133 RepID=A0A9W4E011_9ACTN|nr:hypothetical protein SBRY_10197 [Actinacidiphila bryophytorum]